MDRYKSPISVTHPELAAQAVGWDTSKFTAGSGKKVEWQCKRGHKWKAMVVSRSKGSGCPVCSGNEILVGFNDLATTHPDVAAEADGWDPTATTSGSNKKFNWRCSVGHVWISSPHSRKGKGCGICSGKKVLAGFNDLVTTHPAIALEACGWDPSAVTAGSNKKVGWKCEQGHTWNASVKNRSWGTGCPICSGNQVLIGYNDLATTHPELASQADGWDPSAVTAGSNKKVGWKCKFGHTWSTRVSSRSKGSGCPICSGHQVLAGYNDLATINPNVAELAYDWDPRTVTICSNKRMNWKCRYGHIFSGAVSGRILYGCPVCSGRQVQVGFNDLATLNPELAAQANGWDPKTLKAYSNKKVSWRCEQGHTWSATVSGRSSGSGCPSCAKYGFSPSKDGWLYLIGHDEMGMFQIGISNSPKQRLARHENKGWELIEIRGPMEGNLARGFEKFILKSLKTRGATMAHNTDIRKFDGYSEAWTKASLPVDSFKQLLEWVYQDDEKQLMTKAL
jgi:Zn finger protein HypA/HybF involved in hydrogenase expression